MPTPLSESKPAARREAQLATFFVADQLFGLEIDRVQEINRRLDVTSVPHAPEAVLGVINLRGEVVTVIDLRSVLGMGRSDVSENSRNMIVSHDGELVGLCVDRIADILNISTEDIDHAPPNLSDIESRHLSGVVPLGTGLVAVLNLSSVLEFD